MFETVRKWLELLSFVSLILGVPLGLIDFHNRGIDAKNDAEKQRVEAAEQVYATVDARYTDFVQLCIDHPRLDCYSVPETRQPKPPLKETEKVQQKMMYSYLTDVFEVAYVQYHKEETNPEIRKIYDSQWTGWDAYIRKFLARPAYLRTWYEIRDEYDKGFEQYMDSAAALHNGAGK